MPSPGGVEEDITVCNPKCVVSKITVKTLGRDLSLNLCSLLGTPLLCIRYTTFCLADCQSFRVSCLSSGTVLYEYLFPKISVVTNEDIAAIQSVVWNTAVIRRT